MNFDSIKISNTLNWKILIKTVLVLVFNLPNETENTFLKKKKKKTICSSSLSGKCLYLLCHGQSPEEYRSSAEAGCSGQGQVVNTSSFAGCKVSATAPQICHCVAFPPARCENFSLSTSLPALPIVCLVLVFHFCYSNYSISMGF